MAKQILLVFQDCYNCDTNKEWYDSQTEKATQNAIVLEPTPHDFPGTKGLILEAKARGCERLPFLTDGKKYGYDIATFVDESSRRSAKKKEVKDGDNSKAD